MRKFNQFFEIFIYHIKLFNDKKNEILTFLLEKFH